MTVHCFFNGVLKRMARRGYRSRNGIQMAINARTTLALEKWILDKGYCINETMGELADRLDISKSQLSEYCRMVVRKPFPSWRKQLRIMEAQRVWKENPDMSVIEVATIVGIPDRTNFRRQFFEITRVNLVQWLEELRDSV